MLGLQGRRDDEKWWKEDNGDVLEGGKVVDGIAETQI